MKKPKLTVEDPQPRNIQRADIAPIDGYSLVVDGHFKTEFAEKAAAKKAVQTKGAAGRSAAARKAARTRARHRR